MNKKEMLDFIKNKIWEKEIFIWDIFDYIDKNLFREKTKVEGWFEINILKREKCIISLYNYFLLKHNKSIGEQNIETIEFIYNLIK